MVKKENSLFSFSIEENKTLIETKSDEMNTKVSNALTTMFTAQSTAFLASDIMGTKRTFEPSLATMATNGKKIIIGPKFLLGITKTQVMYSLSHEKLHMLWLHCDKKRIGSRDMMRWNVAGDAIIASMLKASNIQGEIEGTITADSNYDVKLNINNKQLVISKAYMKSIEEVYDLLTQHCKENPPKGKDKTEGKSGGDEYGNQYCDEKGNTYQPDLEGTDFSEEEIEEIKDSVRRIINEDKMRGGKLPACMIDSFEAIIQHKPDIKSEVRDMISPEIKSRTSYSHRNKRSISAGVILPGQDKEGLIATVGIDLSGSMGTTEINNVLGILSHLFDQFEPGAVTLNVLTHNTDVIEEFDLKDKQTINTIQLNGGGGTSHKQVFERAEELGSKVIILFTDGYSEFPEYSTIPKKLWIVTDKRGCEQIPSSLGKVIYVPVDDLN